MVMVSWSSQRSDNGDRGGGTHGSGQYRIVEYWANPPIPFGNDEHVRSEWPRLFLCLSGALAFFTVGQRRIPSFHFMKRFRGSGNWAWDIGTLVHVHLPELGRDFGDQCGSVSPLSGESVVNVRRTSSTGSGTGST